MKFTELARQSEKTPGQLALFHIGRNEAAGYFYYVMELADDSAAESKVQDAGSNKAKRSDGVVE